MTGLRFSNVMEPADYAGISGLRRRPDAAAVESVGVHRRPGRRPGGAAGAAASRPGMDVFVIAAADTVMSRSSADLAAEVFPDVRVTRELGTHETLLGIDKARRVLGFEPKFSWRSAANA